MCKDWHYDLSVIKSVLLLLNTFYNLCFTALSRIFHLCRADHEALVGENWRFQGKKPGNSCSKHR